MNLNTNPKAKQPITTTSTERKKVSGAVEVFNGLSRLAAAAGNEDLKGLADKANTAAAAVLAKWEPPVASPPTEEGEPK